MRWKLRERAENELRKDILYDWDGVFGGVFDVGGAGFDE